MENSKGKPINTSVPSIAIRFNANAEEIEELYQSEEESADKSNHEKTKPIGIGDPESSPLRSYLPRIGKRSTSIDASLTTQDSSPPSDRWKFFTEIKGKITKSVEETITEIKHRNQEDSLKKSKASKDKDNSSLSESEDISESSISKTCGIVSTTEGVEMSSDDDTPSIERDKEVNKKQKCSSTSTNLKQKFKIIRRKKSPKDNSISANTLANLYELNTGVKVVNKRSRSSENVEVESGVEALEDSSLQLSDSFLSSKSKSESIVCDNKAGPSKDEILTNVLKQIKNIEVDDSSDIKIQPVTGAEIRKTYLTDTKSYTYFAPEGFVDLREYRPPLTWYDYVYSYRYIIALAAVLLFYFSITIPLYVQGFATGMILTLAVTGIYNKFCSLNTASTGLTDGPFPIPVFRSPGILEIPAVKEYQPITKFEGWMNEYPEIYNPQTYHICQTQSVYVRLQGNLLRISHTRSKIPKRAMWNESKHKLQFTEHRIYNLIGAKITLLPEGLNKRRHWSKKYPICITLNKTHENFSYLNVEQEKSEHACPEVEEPKRKRSFLHKKKVVVQPQIFSKLAEEDFDLESENSRHSTPSPPEASLEVSESAQINENDFDEDEEVEEILRNVFDVEDQMEDELICLDDWSTFTPEEDNPNETHIYLFGRTNREKEDWFRRFVTATHKGANVELNESNSNTSLDKSGSFSDTIIEAAKTESEYLKYMAKLEQGAKYKQNKLLVGELEQTSSVIWINALIGRVLFDCTRDEGFTNIVKDRIQRKLSSIKLPYFIEQLSISELSLGSSPPLIHKASKPVLDQRGLWVDLDITYEGVVVLVLQTKLNLMKLKQPPTTETVVEESSSAKWLSSDVDDTAESSTDDDTQFLPPTKILDETGNPVIGLGGSSNTSKKFIKMVDKIAESKFFQAATENRYIKKAMEGVSNTDLSLKVELKGLIGTLVLNMPPPPSDRLWIGFRPSPKLWLTAQPIVGERNFSFIKYLTNWIEKKLSSEFQKVLVIPNMEDILIPVMAQNLPQ